MFSDLAWWQYAFAALALTHASVMSVTIYLHRFQTHRALMLHPFIDHCFRVCLWLTTGTKTKEWVAVHRKHHKFVEIEGDPHSPQSLGILKVLFLGVVLYRKEAKNQETLRLYGHGTPDDWAERHIYTRSRLGVELMLALDLVLFGLAGFWIWIAQISWMPVFAAGVINGIGHFKGYRNYETPDASRNILPLGILCGGEELHNNHHHNQPSAKFSHRWFEVDLGWLYILLLEKLHLAYNVRRPQIA